MNERGLLAGMAIACALIAGCGLETRNRVILSAAAEGSLGERALTPDQSTTLLESRAVPGFAAVTFEQRADPGLVEVTLVFEDGIDAVVEDQFGVEETIALVARGGAGRSAWEPDVEGRVVSVEPFLAETEDIETVEVRGVRERWIVTVVVAFGPTTEPTGLVEAEPDPSQMPAEAERVVIRVRYVRDRVRNRPRDTSATPDPYYDC